MAHPQQQEFIEKIKRFLPEYFKEVDVIDVGSYDINGNNLGYFSGSRYLGVDVIKGNNVDVVSFCHELPDSFDDKFDTVISTEMMEHDSHYAKSLQKMVKMLKSKGLLIFTCATVGRVEHGTLKHSPKCSATTQLGLNYYKNLTEQDVRDSIDVDNIFSNYKFEFNNTTHDLYFFGIKK